MKNSKGMIDGIKATGQVIACLRGPDGKIKVREEFNNLVVTVGRAHIADQLAGKLQASMSNMAIGDGTTTQTAEDTQLVSQVNSKALSSVSQGIGADANKVIYIGSWPAGEGTGSITEAGIFNSANVMLCRTTFGVKEKEAGDSLSLTWTISFSA